MARRVLAFFALRAAERAAIRYDRYQAQPATGVWSVHIATALRNQAEAKAMRAARLMVARR